MKSSKAGTLGPHDYGGVDVNETVVIHDHTVLSQWEKSVHALLVILSSNSLITTDELRRGVESLNEASYSEWGYYDKWSAAMAVILLERQVISQNELDEELFKDDEEAITAFQVGDKIQIKTEKTRTRWRRPHLRTPGYVFGLEGKIVKVLGEFADPFLLAFRGEGPKQTLYSVEIPLKNIKDSITGNAAGEDGGENDSVLLDIYGSWIEPCQENTKDTEAHDQTHAVFDAKERS